MNRLVGTHHYLMYTARESQNYQTINYEGTKSKIVREDVPPNVNSNEYESYHNLVAKEGWFVDTITTNKQKGHVNEFIEKEGKWFNYIKGKKWQ